jgi:hypothetical protein
MKNESNISERARPYPELSRRAQRGLLYLVVFTPFALMLIPETAEAQCSMCRAVTNSNQLSDDAFTVGNGLNNAIVYLMFTPYVMATLFFYAFYRKPITAWLKTKFSS